MKIFLKLKVIKHLSKIPTSVRRLIESRIELLGNNPYPSGFKKLLAREGYRIRIGDYRVLYTIDKKRKEITILNAKHRKEAYRI